MDTAEAHIAAIEQALNEFRAADVVLVAHQLQHSFPQSWQAAVLRCFTVLLEEEDVEKWKQALESTKPDTSLLPDDPSMHWLYNMAQFYIAQHTQPTTQIELVNVCSEEAFEYLLRACAQAPHLEGLWLLLLENTGPKGERITTAQHILEAELVLHAELPHIQLVKHTLGARKAERNWLEAPSEKLLISKTRYWYFPYVLEILTVETKDAAAETAIPVWRKLVDTQAWFTAEFHVGRSRLGQAVLHQSKLKRGGKNPAYPTDKSVKYANSTAGYGGGWSGVVALILLALAMFMDTSDKPLSWWQWVFMIGSLLVFWWQLDWRGRLPADPTLRNCALYANKHKSNLFFGVIPLLFGGWIALALESMNLGWIAAIVALAIRLAHGSLAQQPKAITHRFRLG